MEENANEPGPLEDSYLSEFMYQDNEYDSGDDRIRYDDAGREEDYFRDPESSALGTKLPDEYYPDEDEIDPESPFNQIRLLAQRINLTTDLNEKIELQTKRLALLKISKGHVHVSVVRALLELSHLYIQSDALQSALLHVEKSLKTNYAIAEQLDQYEQQFDDHFESDSEEEREAIRLMKAHCDQMSNKILITVAIIHLKQGNLEMSQVLLKKVQKIMHLLLDMKEQFGENIISDQDEFPVLFGLALNYNALGSQYYEDTERTLIACWELKEQLGSAHPMLLPVYYRLAKLYTLNTSVSTSTDQPPAMKDLPRAIEMYERALKILVPLLEKQREDTVLPPVLDEAHLRYVIADLYSKQNDYEKAVEHLERATQVIDQYRRHYVMEGKPLYFEFLVWVTQVTLAYAFSLVKCERYKKATTLLQVVVRDNDRELHPQQTTPRSARKPVPLSGLLTMTELIDVYKKLGTIFVVQKQYEDALVLYRRACFLSAKFDQQQYNLRLQQILLQQHHDGKPIFKQEQPPTLNDFMSETTRDLINRTAKLRSMMIAK
jgi:tetratricopeptide (TPR) repeat protein